MTKSKPQRLSSIVVTLGQCIILFLCSRVALGASSADAPNVVVRNCSGCHGLNGQAQLSYIPNLAGLQASYLESRLDNFRASPNPPADELFYRLFAPRRSRKLSAASNVRTNMVGMAHSLAGTELESTVDWYAAQPEPGSRGARGKAIVDGQRLFELGSQQENIPACKSCHGADARGQGHKAPRLAHQNSEYLLIRLYEFRSDKNEKASVMNGIAKHLTPGESRSLAAFLQAQ